MSCPICERRSVPSFEFCVRHLAAKKNLDTAFPLWVEAYGGIEWKDYLDSVKRNPQTGQWVKEIAGHLGGSKVDQKNT